MQNIELEKKENRKLQRYVWLAKRNLKLSHLENIRNIVKNATVVITNKLIPIKELEAKIILGTLLELLKRNTAVTGKSNPKKQEKEINILVKFVGVKEPKMEEGCLFITSHPGTHSKILKT